jgi:Protein of unknown function (DUF1524)
MQHIVPSDETFRQEFERASVSTQYLARYYLGVIEAYVPDGTKEVIVNPNPEKVTLEHIMPQSPGGEWEHITDEDRQNHKRRLGNLTLLDKGLNEKAGNISFARKREIFEQSSIQMTRDLAGVKEWTIQAVDDRQKQMADIAVKAWDAKPKS